VWCPGQRREVVPEERSASQPAIQLQLRTGPARADHASNVPSAVRCGMQRARETREAR